MNVSAPESQDSTLANRNRCQNLPCYRKAWERAKSMCAKGPLHPSYIHAPRAWQAFSATLWNVLGGFDDEPTSTRAYLINANAKSRRRLMQRALNYDCELSLALGPVPGGQVVAVTPDGWLNDVSLRS
ncbi:uncharacterized protein CIMG_03250 [Coccidioides immitis RS]|uniref:Uncharacterized protein n=1 Tax=Coccidioides immitis (strain RS) TaxID=246410 RepID=A0A0D8JYX9_COCIM|nr:uncharacterized protein CIMG_03250 [Coccidioides immitis RS]KJF61473.1 hypothetical protein CIMG_03250 [Coccidioides immitis RS]